jgi:hypothetical protein
MEIKLKLKIKDVEIELSPDEAKKLIEVLQAVCGGKMQIVEKKEYIPYYYPHPYYWEWPYWTYISSKTSDIWIALGQSEGTIPIGNDVKVSYSIT